MAWHVDFTSGVRADLVGLEPDITEALPVPGTILAFTGGPDLMVIWAGVVLVGGGGGMVVATRRRRRRREVRGEVG